jgi:hypothetical protein
MPFGDDPLMPAATASPDPAQSNALGRAPTECLVTLEGLENWLERAPAGAWLVYQRGPFMVHDAVTRRIGELCEAGLLDPWQPISPGRPGCRDYKCQRTSTALAGGSARPAPPEPDAALDDILRELKRAANFDQPCPTDAELARKAKLSSRAQAADRVRRLIAAGLIRSRRIEGGPDGIWRVVTIAATGRHTRLPRHERDFCQKVKASLDADDAEARGRSRTLRNDLPKPLRRAPSAGSGGAK